MNTSEANQIIDSLDDYFDSHDFILALYMQLPAVYGSFLVEHNNVNTAHAEISNFLRYNSKDLGICELDKVTSPNIYGKPTECAAWAKLLHS